MISAETDADGRRRMLRHLLGDVPGTAFRIEARSALPASPGARAERLDLVGAAGERVRGLLTAPAQPRRGLPAVVYCHAHGGRYAIGAEELIEGRPALLDPPYAQALAEAGIMALAIDLPCFGERVAESEGAAAKRALLNGTTLFGRMVADLAGAAALLPQLGADPARIGAMGLSMGATLAVWLGALDPRIKAVAHLCCFADFATLVETGAHDLHGIYMAVPGLLPAITTGGIAGLVAPRPQLACMGADDPLTPPAAIERAVADARRAYEAQGAGAAFTALVEAGVGHKETSAMREAVLGFLREAL